MLSDLEARLEDLLSDISQMPEEYVAKAEKVWNSCKDSWEEKPTPKNDVLYAFAAPAYSN